MPPNDEGAVYGLPCTKNLNPVRARYLVLWEADVSWGCGRTALVDVAG
jgi:hypothetical protein